MTTVPAWSPGTLYPAGTLVGWAGQTFEAVIEHTNVMPRGFALPVVWRLHSPVPGQHPAPIGNPNVRQGPAGPAPGAANPARGVVAPAQPQGI